MAIRKLREIINDNPDITVDNIQRLPVTPQLRAKEIQAEFDKNVDNLIDAIDGQNGLIASIQANITQAGGGDMSEAEYATGENPSSSQFPVDRARYADTLRVSVSNGMLYLGIASEE